MSRREDDLDGFEELSPHQKALVNRYTYQARRHDRTGYIPTNREISERFHRAEDWEDRNRFGRS